MNNKDLIKNVKHNWIFLTANILFYLLIVIIFPVKFESNDDVVMAWIASGIYSGTPDFHLVFINVIYGHIVSFLYSVYPKIEWYSLLFSICQIISMTVISKLIYTNSKISKLNKWLSISLLGVFELIFVLSFQFTTVSALTGLAGLLLLTKNKRSNKVFGGLLFVIGALIRFEAAMLVGLVFTPMYFFIIKSIKKEWQKIIPLFIVVSIAITFKTYDKYVYYKDADWKNYYEYNYYRGKLNDNPNFGYLLENVNDNSIELLACSFADKEILTISKLKKLKSLIDDVPLSNKFENAIIELDKIKYIWGLFFLFVVLIKFKKEFLDISNFVIIGYFAYIFSLMIYISLNGTLKERVLLSILVASYVSVLYFIKLKHKHLLSFVLIITIGFYGLVSYNKFMHQKNNTWDEHRTLISNLSKEDVLAPIGADLCAEFIPAYSVSKNIDVNIKGLGWLTNVPFNADVIDNHKDIVENSINIFCEKSSKQKVFELLSANLLDNYNIKTKIQNVDSSENYVIFKLVED